jgi:hypothetical protein
MRELAYLANVLAAGCSLSRRSMRPVEGARAAVATCNLGLARALAGTGASPALALKRTSADKLFRIGWNILFHTVVSTAANTAAELLAREMPTSHPQRAATALRAAMTAGKPWLALHTLEGLEERVGQPAFAALAALLDECPSLAGKLSPSDKEQIQFIATDTQVEAARAFLTSLVT